MKDIRLQLPECPLEYEVPFIPGTHTALVIPVNAADIDWQERMLPWTLASLINNTDIVMQGVHLYIACENGIENRIRTAIKGLDLPEGTITEDGSEVSRKPTGFQDTFSSDFKGTKRLVVYDIVYIFNINCWAFRDGKNQIKLSIGHALKDPTNPPLEIEDPPSAPFYLKDSPCLCDMTHATVEDFHRAIKHLMAAQLAMEI